MAATSSSSSPSSRRYDVFPSFSGVDVRKTFLSHLIEALDRRSINTFMDHGIVRSCIIADELISAIREARISIVIFSENYASSTWCLNELVEIHKCYEKGDQMVIPVFYGVDPSEVRKQIGGFGDVFKKTCEDKPVDQKQRWVKALTDISNLAGEDLRNGPNEAFMVEKIANDVSNKLFPLPKGFGDFVGIEDHIKAIKSILCLESKEARIMVGIWGQSGIGKSTIGRALYSQLSIQFHHRAFVTYKSTSGSDVSGMKLSWEKELLSEILGQKDIKIEHFGVVEQRLKHKKVLILLDDVDNLEFLKTLVGKAEWFGSGSRIIVITQDRQLLKAHEIDLIYEVKLPSQGLALKMICRSAFGKDSPPDDYRELAVEVVELAGNLPLGLSVLGSSLKGRDKDEWEKMMPRLRKDSDDKIEEILRVGYDSYVKELLEDDVGLTMLAEKSLIRITPGGYIEMHNLLEKLGREIDRAKSKGNPGKRQFLTNFEDIHEVVTEKTGTETLLGIRLPFEEYFSRRSLLIDKESFKGMRNLQYLKIGDWSDGGQPQSLVYLPLKLRLLDWDDCPLKSLPSTFKAEYLVNLIMKYSKLEKLWEGTLPLGSLKKMNLLCSKNLKEIPDLSNAINLEELDLRGCESLVTLPSSIQNAIKLWKLHCSGMCNLEYLSVDCSRMEGTQGIVYFPSKLRLLLWNNCPLKRLHSNFKAEYLVKLRMENSDLEKLWDGTQPLGRLKQMFLRGSKYLKEIPDLSLAINLEELDLRGCESLVTLPSSIQNATKLIFLDMKYCKKLESFPTDLNLESLKYLNLTGCPNLRNFPAIIMGCSDVDFPEGRNEFRVEDCFWNKNLPAGLDYLDCLMRCMPCEFRPEQLTFLNVSGYKLEKLWEGIQSLGSLEGMDLSESENLTEIPDLSKATKLESLILNNCKSLVTLPSTIGNLHRLVRMEMKECTGLELLPTDINLSSLETLDLSGCSSLRSFPLISTRIKVLYLKNTAIEEILDLSKATNLKRFYLSGCKSLVTLPSTIGNLHRLVRLEMKECTGLELLPTDINLSSLETLDLSGCSSLRSFPLISKSIKWLYLENTAIEEVPCCIEDFTRLTVLLMYCCQRLKNISPNIFRLTSLTFADFTDCRGVIKALSDATVVATMEDSVSCAPLSENIEYTCQRFWEDNFVISWKIDWDYFSFRNCFKLERDARELILRSCFKPLALPGGEIPKCFTYRAYGDSLTVTLPQSSLSQYFLRFKACVVVDPLSEGKGLYPYLEVSVGFNGKQYQRSFFEDAELQFCKMDHLFFCSFKFKSGLTFNDVEFKFCCSNRIKECGVRLLYVSQETEYNQQTTRSKKRMRMTSGTSEEYINLAGDQIVADTGLAALNLELPLGQGEASSSTSLEGEDLCVDAYMITEEQDEQIPILYPVPGN
uniref:ADP-ribosyl cyclase/cyclic ADP-ribose hydrolase n=1 Tax=Arabidopsis thaliana TaxID=3702 RepID=A0A346XQF7_ARATH|nr:RPP4/RPP5-like protein [Arabidopsis thaliana]